LGLGLGLELGLGLGLELGLGLTGPRRRRTEASEGGAGCTEGGSKAKQSTPSEVMPHEM
jgi:hypothetical protein